MLLIWVANYRLNVIASLFWVRLTCAGSLAPVINDFIVGETSVKQIVYGVIKCRDVLQDDSFILFLYTYLLVTA